MLPKTQKAMQEAAEMLEDKFVETPPSGNPDEDKEYLIVGCKKEFKSYLTSSQKSLLLGLIEDLQMMKYEGTSDEIYFGALSEIQSLLREVVGKLG